MQVLSDFSNSFEGLFHTFLPISQSNCPGRDGTSGGSTSINDNASNMVAEQQGSGDRHATSVHHAVMAII
jgi:hypothetical protein